MQRKSMKPWEFRAPRCRDPGRFDDPVAPLGSAPWRTDAATDALSLVSVNLAAEALPNDIFDRALNLF